MYMGEEKHTMRIETIGVRRAIERLLPHMATAGRLANRIQDAMLAGVDGSAESKASDGRFGAALTDADIAVETMLGGILLAHFHDVTFFGEEHERDRVSAYFPEHAPYTVTLDPINGTLYFKDGLPLYDMVLTIRRDDAYEAVVVLLPRAERFWIGIRNVGAFTTTSADVVRGTPWQRFAVPVPTSRLVYTHRVDDDELRRVRDAGFRTLHQERDYDRRRTTLASNSILLGDAVALVKRSAHLIDWGAFGFLVRLAGGVTNDFESTFDPTTLRAPFMVAAADLPTYERIMRALHA